MLNQELLTEMLETENVEYWEYEALFRMLC